VGNGGWRHGDRLLIFCPFVTVANRLLVGKRLQITKDYEKYAAANEWQ